MEQQYQDSVKAVRDRLVQFLAGLGVEGPDGTTDGAVDVSLKSGTGDGIVSGTVQVIVSGNINVALHAIPVGSGKGTGSIEA